MGTALLACYALTLAPGVTFWDAGEFIAAAHGLGIPHPPGTPLYVAMGRVWILALAPVAGAARAMNLLSAACTAMAGAITAWLMVRETLPRRDAAWGAMAGALCAGLMATAWANATETEVYAVSLLHVAVLLACALRAANADGDAGWRWVLLTTYVLALAPALHLSALVGAPAAIALAARHRDGRWRTSRAVFLGGALVVAAGVGRVSAALVVGGAAIMLAAFLVRVGDEGSTDAQARIAPVRFAGLLLPLIAASALLILLVRASQDPALNQGNPSTLRALVDVVGRRQYDVAPMLPRQAPVWLQLANVAQYVDWQIALGWGRGIFTTPARVAATMGFLVLGALGVRAMRRDSVRIADALLVLLACGTLGVAAYLNLKAGSSLGWGVIADSAPHEARERDYFFVLGFWAWGCFAGYGALSVVRARRWPAPLALAVLVVPLLGNWQVSDRSRAPRATAAYTLAVALLESAPPRAVLFTAGDNDSYPLWYAQQVEGRRSDVTLVTLSLLPAQWYQAEIARRTGLRWRDEPVRGARWAHEQQGALISAAARHADRPVAATPAVTAAERAFLGDDWWLEGVLYRSRHAGTSGERRAQVDSALTRPWVARAPLLPQAAAALVDDVSSSMLVLLTCPRLAQRRAALDVRSDSLEVKCNLR